jgi:hypothetical protein
MAFRRSDLVGEFVLVRFWSIFQRRVEGGRKQSLVTRVHGLGGGAR